MGLNAFLTGLANLEKIRRAPGFFKYTEHTVAAHSFRVAMIAQTLADIEEVSGNKINWQTLYEKSLNHDYSVQYFFKNIFPELIQDDFYGKLSFQKEIETILND